MDAADEMYRIEAAHEAEPGLTPLLSIELTRSTTLAGAASEGWPRR